MQSDLCLLLRPRVILIRDNAETLTCSNCAGTLEGIDAFGSRKASDYEPIREIMNQAGRFYRALLQKFGNQVEIEVVDPRNALYLLPALLADYRRYHPRLRSFFRTLLMGPSPASVIVNGRARYIGELPSLDALIEEIGKLLKDATYEEAVSNASAVSQ